MSVSTLRTSITRLSHAMRPAGDLVVVTWYACESETTAAARGQTALGRDWRPDDLLVLVAQEGPCLRRRHAHDDPVLITPRQDS